MAITLELLLKVISTLSTLAIGLAAWLLAYQQLKLSKSKLKFDLYEKRLALFKIVRDFASTLVLRGDADSGQLYRETIERYFLFDEDVCTYIGEMYERAKQVEQTKQELSRPSLTPEERQSLNKKLVGDKTWFFDQSDKMIEVFSKDLSIKTLR